MDIVTKLQGVQAQLLEINADPESTVAMIFIPEQIPSPADVVAIKHGAKICDMVVVAPLVEKLDEKFYEFIEQAGADILLDVFPKAPKALCKVELTTSADSSINQTLLLQQLLAVMPSLVVVNHQQALLSRSLRALELSFVNLFTLELAGTPRAILQGRQEELMNTLLLAQEAIKSGERSTQVVLQTVLSGLSKAKFDFVKELSILDEKTFQEQDRLSFGTYFIHAVVEDNGKDLTQSVKLNV